MKYRTNTLTCAPLLALTMMACAHTPSHDVALQPLVASGAFNRALPDGRRCQDDARVVRHTPVSGVMVWRCERHDPVAAGSLAEAHGPSLTIARRLCDDGQMHEVRIGRTFVHGEQIGREYGASDGRWAYTRTLSADDLDTVERAASAKVEAGPAMATGWAHTRRGGRACDGLHLCGAPVGYAVCIDDDQQTRGAHLHGRLHGYGVRGRKGQTARGWFRGGQLHGRAFVNAANGDRLKGSFRDDRRHGFGRTEFPGGGWLTGRWRDGHLTGRVVWENAQGVRVVTRWREGEEVRFIRRFTVQRRHRRTQDVVSLTVVGRINAHVRRDSFPWLMWTLERKANELQLHFWHVAAGSRADALASLPPTTVPGGLHPAHAVAVGRAPLAGRAAVIDEHERAMQRRGKPERLTWVDHGAVARRGAPQRVGAHWGPQRLSPAQRRQR